MEKRLAQTHELCSTYLYHFNMCLVCSLRLHLILAFRSDFCNHCRYIYDTLLSTNKNIATSEGPGYLGGGT